MPAEDHSGAKKRFNLTRPERSSALGLQKSHILTKKDTSALVVCVPGGCADTTNVGAIHQDDPPTSKNTRRSNRRFLKWLESGREDDAQEKKTESEDGEGYWGSSLSTSRVANEGRDGKSLSYAPTPAAG